MKKEFSKYYKMFDENCGLDAQIDIAIEEMSELTKELCKYRRNKDNKVKVEEIIKNIQEEIADVLNMTEQLEYCFGEENIENIRQEKIKRTIERTNIKGDTN